MKLLSFWLQRMVISKLLDFYSHSQELKSTFKTFLEFQHVFQIHKTAHDCAQMKHHQKNVELLSHDIFIYVYLNWVYFHAAMISLPPSSCYVLNFRI